MSHAVRFGSLRGVVPLRSLPLPPGLVAAYLERLGVAPPHAPPDISLLRTLQRAHIESVSYENIDMQLPDPFRTLIDPESSARRVSLDGRGCYCFVLVGAYSALLCSLGFSCSLHTAACSEEPPPEHKWGNHVVCVVHLQGELWVSDVGLGDGPRFPFLLQEHSFVEDNASYQVMYRGSGEWRWNHDPNGCFPGFSVDMSTSAASVTEFERSHGYLCSMGSPFVDGNLVLQKRMEQGALELRSCTLQLVRPGGKEVLERIESYERWIEVTVLTLVDADI